MSPGEVLDLQKIELGRNTIQDSSRRRADEELDSRDSESAPRAQLAQEHVDSHLDAASIPDAASAVLGVILNTPNVLDQVRAMVEVRHFPDPRHQTVYAACLALSARAIAPDPTTVKEQLERTGKLAEAGGVSTLAALFDDAPPGSNLDGYIKILREARLHQESKRLLSSATEVLQEGLGDPVPIISKVMQELNGLLASEGQSADFLSHDTNVQAILAAEFPPQLVLLEKLLYPRALTLLVGAGGVGKTSLGFQFFACLASGQPLFGLQATPCRVGYWAMETPAAYAQEKLRVLAGKGGLSECGDRAHICVPGYPAGFPSRWDIMEPKLREAMIKWILDRGIQVMILDPLVHFHNLDENDTSDMNRLMAALAEIRERANVALLVTHHTGKANRRKGQQGRGSTVPFDEADVEITLDKHLDGLKVHWSKGPRHDVPPEPFYIKRDEAGVFRLWSPKPRKAGKSPKGKAMAKPVARREAVGEALKAAAEPLSLRELCGRVRQRVGQASEETVRRDLREMQKAGEVTAVDRGKNTRYRWKGNGAMPARAHVAGTRQGRGGGKPGAGVSAQTRRSVQFRAAP